MPLRLEEQYPYYADRIGEARNEGFHDDEIFDWIQGRVVEAQDEGYSAQEIYDFMGSPQEFQPLTEADLSGADAFTGAEQPPPEPVEPFSFIRPDAISEADPGTDIIRTRHQLDPQEEASFRSWYKNHADKWNLNPDPDAFEQKYNYRGAYLAGNDPDETGHWPSQFKDPDHPNRFVEGVDTITGEPASQERIVTEQQIPGAEITTEKVEEETPLLQRIAELAELPPEQVVPGGLGIIVEEGRKAIGKAFKRSPEEENVRSRNIMSVARSYDIPVEEASKNYDQIIEGLGLRGGPETVPGLAEEMAMKFMLVPVVMGMFTNPVSVGLGLGAFMALDEVENYVVQKTQGENYQALAGRSISELLPEESNQLARDSVELLSFIAKAKAIGMARGLFKGKAQKIFDAFTKNTVQEYGIPKKYYFRPSEVDAVFRTARDQMINPQAEAIIKDLGLTGKQVRQAIRDGLEVEINPEKIVRIADKTYWGRIKGLFRLQPTERVKVKIPKRALPPAEEPKKPPVKPTEKPPEAPPTEKEPGLEEALKVMAEKPPEAKFEARITKLDNYGRLRRTKTRLTNQINELAEEKRAPLLKQLEDKEAELFGKLTPEERAKFEKKPKVKKKVEEPKLPLREEKPEEIAAREEARIENIDTGKYEGMAKEAGVRFSTVYPTEQGNVISFHDPETGGDFSIREAELTPEVFKKELSELRERLPKLTKEERAERAKAIEEEKPIEVTGVREEPPAKKPILKDFKTGEVLKPGDVVKINTIGTGEIVSIKPNYVEVLTGKAGRERVQRLTHTNVYNKIVGEEAERFKARAKKPKVKVVRPTKKKELLTPHNILLSMGGISPREGGEAQFLRAKENKVSVRMISKKGIMFDDAREHFVERGYIPEDMTLSEFKVWLEGNLHKPITEMGIEREVERLESERYKRALEDEAKIAFGSKAKEDTALKNAARQLEAIEQETPVQNITQSIQKYKSRIGKELLKKKRVDLTGNVLTKGKEARDIAQLFQVYRNPRMEIKHFIYTDKDGKILAHNAITSGAVNYVAVKDFNKHLAKMIKRMKRLKAHKVHILHNHPSGNAKLSDSDKSLAQNFKIALKKSMGDYIVIDDPYYEYINFPAIRKTPSGRLRVRRLTGRGTYKPIPGSGMWLSKRGKKITSNRELAGFVKDLMRDNKSIIVALNTQNEINGWASVSDNFLTTRADTRLRLKEFNRAHDAVYSIIATRNPIITARLSTGKAMSDVLFDVVKVDKSGDFISERNRNPEKFWSVEKTKFKIAAAAFEEQVPIEKRLTQEQQKALEVAKKHVKRLMTEAQKANRVFNREYLKSKGYEGKQIRQILQVKRIITQERQPILSPKENAVNVLRMYIRGREEFKELNKRSLVKLKRSLKRKFVDFSGNIKPELMKYGDPGREAVMRHDLAAGATPWARKKYDEVAEQIYGKEIFGKRLTRKGEEALNTVIQSRRTITIDRYKDDVRHPEGFIGVHHKDFLDYENFRAAYKEELNQDISREFYDELIKRADLWYKTIDDSLKEQRENDLIGEQSFKAMIEIGEYQERRFIQHIDPDKTYTFGGGKTITVPSSGIRKLDTGSFRALEQDSKKLLEQYIVRSQNRIAQNKANLALWKLAEDVPDNGIVQKAKVKGKTKKGELTYKEAPAGFEEVDVMIEGQRRAMWMPDEWAREWVMRDPSIDSNLASWIGWLSGAKILRPMATGMFAPEFAITNLARDAAHLWLVTDTFSKFLPYAGVQYGKALNAVWKDAVRKEGLYNRYIELGGGMYFLTHQGSFPLPGEKLPVKVEQSIKNLEKVGSFLGETSEIINRLAIMQQEIWNGKSEEEAAWIARNYIDFYQGGSWSKALDAGIPYLNAAIQGTRGVARTVNKDWKTAFAKIAQIMLLASGLYFASRAINRETADNISDSDKVRYWTIPLPGKVKDSKGNDRGMYLIIAKDQAQRFFAQVAEQSMRAITGEPVVWTQLQKGAKDAIPLLPSDLMPPSLDAYIGYRNNKDFWLQEDIWKSKFYPVGMIEARKEFTRYTHPALKKIGDVSGLSPERLGYALEQFFTYGNVFTSIVGGGLRTIMEGLPGNEGDKVWPEILARQPGLRRMIRLTKLNTDEERRETDLALREIYTRRFSQMQEMRAMSEEYYAQEKQGRPEAKQTLDRIQGYIEEQPKRDQQRLVNMHKDYPLYDDIPDRSWWLSLRNLPSEGKAFVYYSKWVRSSEEKKKQLEEMRGRMPGMMSDGFMEELRELHRKAKELKR